MLNTLEGDTKLGGVVSTLEDRIRIQNDLDKLEKQSKKNKIKFGLCKCKVLLLGKPK